MNFQHLVTNRNSEELFCVSVT